MLSLVTTPALQELDAQVPLALDHQHVLAKTGSPRVGTA
jgi:hypothetical protein